jgi:hypothetical protein
VQVKGVGATKNATVCEYGKTALIGGQWLRPSIKNERPGSICTAATTASGKRDVKSLPTWVGWSEQHKTSRRHTRSDGKHGLDRHPPDGQPFETESFPNER